MYESWQMKCRKWISNRPDKKFRRYYKEIQFEYNDIAGAATFNVEE